MDIEWFDSANPPEVIGRTPDGGFLVHTSLHPLGVTQALERADRAGIKIYDRGKEAYIPMPWLRSELAAMLKQSACRIFSPEVEGIATLLNVTLPQILQQTGKRTFPS